MRQASGKVRLAPSSSTPDGRSVAEIRPVYDPSTVELRLIRPRIVSTVADTQGILPRNMTESLRHRDPEQLTPYEAVLRSFGYFVRLDAMEHEGARAVLERAVQKAPDRGDCWAMLSLVYREEYTHAFNPRPEPIERALAAARRAVDAAPTNNLAHHALARLFFRREFGAFRTAAERALVLPDGWIHGAYLGFQIAYSAIGSADALWRREPHS